MKRRDGSGTFEQRGDRVRGRIRLSDGQQITVWGRARKLGNGQHITAAEDADLKLIEKRLEIEQARVVTDDNMTFRGLLALCGKAKEAKGVRGMRSWWATAQHALSMKFATWDVPSIRLGHIDDELEQLFKKQVKLGRKMKTIAPSTANLVVNVIVEVFNFAVRRQVVQYNVAEYAMRPALEERDVTFFTLEQQLVLRSADVPRHELLPILFAMGTGIREGEMAHLHLVDMDLDGPHPHIWIKWGSRETRADAAKRGSKVRELRSPKSRERRRVPLFGIALQAAREWIQEVLPTFCRNNPLGLMFPRAGGSYRDAKCFLERGSVDAEGRRTDRWYEILAELKLPRLTWHSLRHTTATSLGAGWWMADGNGRAWTIEEISQLLGHSETETTKLYRHIIDTALNGIAAQTSGFPLRPVSEVGGQSAENDCPPAQETLEIPAYLLAETSTRNRSLSAEHHESRGIEGAEWATVGIRARYRALLARIVAGEEGLEEEILAFKSDADRAHAEADRTRQLLSRIEPGPFIEDRFIEFGQLLEAPASSARKGRAG